MNQTIAPLLNCDFLLNTMPREKKKNDDDVDKIKTIRCCASCAVSRVLDENQTNASLLIVTSY